MPQFYGFTPNLIEIPFSNAFMPINPAANLASSFTINDPNWYLGSRATNHVTSFGDGLAS